MNINDFVVANSAKAYLGLNSSAQNTSRVSTSAQTGLDKAEKRIQSEVDVTSAQLSSFGQLKSAVSGAQLAAKALGGLNAASTSATTKTSAQSFVSAFNSAISTARSTSAAAADHASTQSAGRVGRDLVRSVGTDASTRDALKKIGFTLQTDGTLALDTKVFDAAQTADPTAVKATLTKLGQQVDKSATQELASTGSVTDAVSALSQRAALLKNQQNTLASLQQSLASTASGASTSFSSLGLLAYQSY